MTTYLAISVCLLLAALSQFATAETSATAQTGATAETSAIAQINGDSATVDRDTAIANFGRLFTSPQERRALDNLRRNIQPIGPEPGLLAPVAIDPVQLEVPTEVRFSGFIKRADGRYAVWINGQSNLSRATPPIEQASFNDESPYATLRSNQQQAIIKPGQIWSLDTNTVREGYYLDREVTTKP